MPVQRLAFRKHPLRQTLADDGHWLAFVVGELASIEHGDAKRCEKTRPGGAHATDRIFFAVRARVALDCKPRVVEEGTTPIAPRHDVAETGGLDARQLADAARRLAEEAGAVFHRHTEGGGRNID